jgi:hypothetical protein
MLKCSHKNLQDAHAMLQVSHEVVITSVKHFQPHTQECTCSPNFVNTICANVCCSHENFQAEPHCLGRTSQTGMLDWLDRSSSGLTPQEKEKGLHQEQDAVFRKHVQDKRKGMLHL